MQFIIVVSVLGVALGGFSKGLNGFGNALIATIMISAVLPASEAVALVIPSLIASNIELLRELEINSLSSILRDFRYYILGLFVGVTVGTLGIDYMPSSYLKAAVGSFAVFYAASRSKIFSGLTLQLRSICFKSHETGVGLLTGIVYGSTNVALLAVSYLESRDLELRKFKGVLALLILGISVYRIFLASALGMFQGPEGLLLSIGLVFPTILGVKAGEILSKKVENDKLKNLSLALIALIGLRILTTF